MKFIINGMKYNTENMEQIATVEKWYKNNSLIVQSLYPGKEVGRYYECKLWKSAKGNWLLTHEEDYHKTYGEAISEEEAKGLLIKYATDTYETLFEELPEA